MRTALPVLSFASLLLLGGCGMTASVSPGGDVSSASASLRGRVHGGQQPVIGAAVYLYAANTTGNGGPGIAPSPANASVSLLTGAVLANNPGHAGLDAAGHYFVTTDSNGSFSLNGDYNCAAGQQVYVYVTGGDPGAGPNSAIGLLAVLGNCPGGNFAAQVPYLTVNELTTVAAAFAFSGYASDTTHVSSSGTTLAQTGMANAFATASNLVSLTTGTALAVTPGGTGTVPQAQINSLGNTLAACVNTAGPASAPCTTLLGAALSGGSAGTPALETATAAINLVHSPALHASEVLSLQTPTAPFSPSAPYGATFQLAIAFVRSSSANRVAVDAAGNVWTQGSQTAGQTSVATFDVMTPLGVPVPGSPFVQSAVANAPYPNVADWTQATDAAGNVWKPGPGDDISEYSASGTQLSPAGGYLSGGDTQYGNAQNGTGAVAIDGDGNAWAVSYGLHHPSSVIEWSNSGQLLSGLGSAGYSGYYVAAASVYNMRSVAVDGSGNVWTANYWPLGTPTYGVYEYIGVATPVVTSLPDALAAGTQGARP